MAMVHPATVLLLVVLAGYSCSLAAAKKGHSGHPHPPSPSGNQFPPPPPPPPPSPTHTGHNGHSHPSPPLPLPPPASQPGNCHPPGNHGPHPRPSHSGPPHHGPWTSTDATAASTDATATTAATTTAASTDVTAAPLNLLKSLPPPPGAPSPSHPPGQPPPTPVHCPPFAAPPTPAPPGPPLPPPPPSEEMGQDISSDNHPIHAPPPPEGQPPSPETSIDHSHPLPYSDSQHPHHIAATDDSSSSSTQPAMLKKNALVPSNGFGKMSAKSNLIMLQFNMKNEISEFSSQANVFSKTLKGVLSIGTLFESLKTLILAIIKSDDGLSVIVAVEFVYNKTNKRMDIEETRKLFLHTIDFNINDFDLNGFYITSMKAVEFNSANDKLNETDLVGSNKVLIGTVVGSLALIAIAALVIAGMVMYHKKAPKNYEKLPLIIDESATKLPWSKKKNGCYNDKF